VYRSHQSQQRNKINTHLEPPDVKMHDTPSILRFAKNAMI
jgi:hypothetical protein